MILAHTRARANTCFHFLGPSPVAFFSHTTRQAWYPLFIGCAKKVLWCVLYKGIHVSHLINVHGHLYEVYKQLWCINNDKTSFALSSLITFSRLERSSKCITCNTLPLINKLLGMLAHCIIRSFYSPAQSLSEWIYLIRTKQRSTSTPCWSVSDQASIVECRDQGV